MNEFFFGVYPYICLVTMTLGLIVRYMVTPGEWNARSSNLFAQKSLTAGSFLFHYAIILAFFGHIIGLLIPAYILSAVGLSHNVHEAVAGFFGRILAPCVFIGLAILLWRRITVKPVWATSVPMDILVVALIMWQSCTGGFQDFFSNFNVFNTVAPWIRGILTCQPDPELMRHVPFYIKAHVICGFAIFALIPFSRLVHFFSVPVTWVFKPAISYRRRYENL